jgi:2'-5' RNA ligase
MRFGLILRGLAMIRTFVAAAFTVPEEVRELLRRLSRIDRSLRPVAVDNLHVTLKFLGDVDKGQVADITQRMQNVAGTQPAGTVEFRGLGAFPNPARPSVVWIGMHEADFLSSCAAGLESSFEALGFARESRAFQPHLTVMRVKTRPSERLLELLAEMAAVRFGSAAINAITLFRSDLRHEGPRYTELATARLQSTDPHRERRD